MTSVAVCAAVGLFAALRLVRTKADCCSWEGDRINWLAFAGAIHYTALVAAVSFGYYAAALALTVLGYLVSMGLVFRMAWTGKWCRWCLVSAASSYAAFLLAFPN